MATTCAGRATKAALGVSVARWDAAGLTSAFVTAAGRMTIAVLIVVLKPTPTRTLNVLRAGFQNRTIRMADSARSGVSTGWPSGASVSSKSILNVCGRP